MAIADRLAEAVGLISTMRRENMGITAGFASAAQRCPNRPGLVDELGTLFGQRFAAFVVLNDGASATPEALKQHVRENLANYKVPRDITILEELPLSSTGKIVRRELQDRVENA
jgi:hypothetical protein